MAGEWRTIPLGEVVDNFDRLRVPISKNDRKPGPFPYYGAAGVQDWVDGWLFEGRHLLVAEDGSVEAPDGGLVLQLPNGRFWVNNHAHVLRASSDDDTRFVFYSLQMVPARPYMTGAVQQKITQANLNRIPVHWPPAEDRTRIAHVLGALDDKIELNRKMNRTLEEMAQAIFKSWFIDFDGHDDLVDSEIGPVPRGWGVSRADEVADVTIGKTPPRKEPYWFSSNPTDVRWMSIKDLGACGAYISDTSEYLTVEAVERHRVRRIPDNTVVLSFKLTVGRVAITDGEMCSNEAIAHFRLPTDATLTSEFLYCYLRAFRYDDLGSTSSIATAVNSKVIQGMPVLVPRSTAMRRFTEAVTPMFLRLKALARESSTLAALRDTLLPKLISGELRVPEVEELVEAAS